MCSLLRNENPPPPPRFPSSLKFLKHTPGESYYVIVIVLLYSDTVPMCYIFHKKCKIVSIIHIILPHWYETGSWSSSSCKTRTHIFHIFNVIGVDVLVTQGAKASATMILGMSNRNNLVPAHYVISDNAWRFQVVTWTKVNLIKHTIKNKSPCIFCVNALDINYKTSTIFDARHQWWEARVKMFECWKNIDTIKSM